MKNIIRRISLLLVAFSAFLFFGCAELVDCVAPAKPNLHSKTLFNGSVGLSYTEFVEADITNDPNDDDYDYFFSVDNNLPPGMTYFEQDRKVFFSGTPTQAGSFTFKIRLTVDPKYNYDNRLCFGDDTTTKSYTIVIH